MNTELPQQLTMGVGRIWLQLDSELRQVSLVRTTISRMLKSKSGHGCVEIEHKSEIELTYPDSNRLAT